MRSYVVGPSFAALLLVSTEGWCEQPRTQEEVATEEASEALEPRDSDYPLRSKSAMVTGIVLTGSGGGMLMSALWLSTGLSLMGGDENEGKAAVLAGVGVVAVAIGIPLTVYGAADDPYATRAELVVSPTSVGFRGAF